MKLFDPQDATNIGKNADSKLLNLLVENQETGLAEILKAGIKMAQEGKKTEAKRLLLYVTDVQPNNEVAWLWLASVSEYPEELLCFLKNVLRINPSNQRALEWQKATRALMSKTFVQRGISAHKENCQELARQFFEEAIKNDEENEVAWLWLASVEEDIQKKISYLEKVLQLNPENETAKSSLNAIRKQKARELLKQANIAVVAGNNDEAYEKLEELIQLDPDIEEAWLLKAYLATSFEEKLFCFEKVLSLDPNNEMAKAGVEALREIKETPTEAEVEKSTQTQEKREDAESTVAEGAIAADEAKEITALGDTFEKPITLTQTEPISKISEQQEVTAEKANAILQQEKVSVEESKVEIAETEVESSQKVKLEIETKAEELLQEKLFKEEESVKEEFEKKELLTDRLSDDRKFVVEEQEETIEHPPVETTQEETVTEQETKAEQEIKEQEPLVEAKVEEEREITEEAETVETVREIFETEKKDFEEAKEAEFGRVEEVEEVRREEEIQVAESKEEQVTEAEEATVSPVIQEEAVSTETVETEEIIEDLQEIQEKSETEQGKVIEEVSSAQESAKPAVETVRVPLILVVDDSSTVRKLITTKLEKSGYRVAQAVDGLDALEKINQEIPDLVLLDITMPNLDGYEVCKMIRSNEATKHIPVVMISGKDGFFDKVRGRMVGSTGYITKPFGPETLMSTVATYVKSSQKTN